MRSKIGQGSGWMARSEDVPLRQLVAVPVDVGKFSAKLQACDFSGRTLLAPCAFASARPRPTPPSTILQRQPRDGAGR